MQKGFKIFLSVVLVFAFVFICACSSKPALSPEDNSYISVNGEEISKEYIGYFFYLAKQNMLSEAGFNEENSTDEAIKQFWENTEIEGKDAIDTARDFAVNHSIDLKIQYQKALKEGITLTDEEMKSFENEISELIKLQGGEKDFDKKLAQMDTDRQSYKTIRLENLYVQKLFQKYIDDKVILVTDDEISSYKASVGILDISDEEIITKLTNEKFENMVSLWRNEAKITINDNNIKTFEI